jgi:ribonuclease BN (tRNA processing enzyme)
MSVWQDQRLFGYREGAFAAEGGMKNGKWNGMVALALLAAATVSASAQQPAATAPAAQAAAPNLVRLITLGTRAGEFPAPYRAQTSYALVVGQDIYLIDVGDGTLRRLAEAGLTIRNVAGMFITHLHDDHTSGLPALMSVEWQFHREKPVGIYGPAQTAGLVQAALAFTKFNADTRISDGTMTRPISEIFAGHDVMPGAVFYKDANISVSAVENSHYGNFKPGTPDAGGKTKSYSYRVTTPAGTIVFTGDTGPSDAVAGLAKGADVLVSEVMDLDKVIQLRKADGSWATWTPSQRDSLVAHVRDEHAAPAVVAGFAKNGVGAVILSHLPPDLDLKDDYRWAADKVKKAGYAGPVFVSQDLSEYDLVPHAGGRPQLVEKSALRQKWLGKN